MKFDAKQAPGCGPHPRPLSAVDTAYGLTQSVGFFWCPLDLGANGIESLLLQMVLEFSGTRAFRIRPRPLQAMCWRSVDRMLDPLDH